MSTAAYRGVVKGGMVFLENGSNLHEGTEVLVTPIASARGSPAAVLAAVEMAPRVPPEWVDEMEQLIAEGRRPPTRFDLFSEGQSNQEAS